MPGYMLHHNQTGHPVMGEIGPRRTAVFIGRACRFDYLKLRHNIKLGKQSHAKHLINFKHHTPKKPIKPRHLTQKTVTLYTKAKARLSLSIK